MISYVERLVRFALPIDYCKRCRLEAAVASARLKRTEPTECDKTNGEKCNYLQHEPPFQVHPDNWLPLLLYDKIRNLSPLRSVTLGHASQVRRAFSVEAMMAVLDLYCPAASLTRKRFLVDALGEINKTYTAGESASISYLSEQANRDIKKRSTR